MQCTVFFCWKNVRISHFFNKKKQWICNIYVFNFNETLTNDVVNFEQLGPDHVFFVGYRYPKDAKLFKGDTKEFVQIAMKSRLQVWPPQGGSLLPSSLKIMLWSPQIPVSFCLSSLKVFCLCSPNPQNNSAAPQIPKNLSQFSLKYIFLSLGPTSHTHQIHDKYDLMCIWYDCFIKWASARHFQQFGRDVRNVKSEGKRRRNYRLRNWTGWQCDVRCFSADALNVSIDQTWSPTMLDGLNQVYQDIAYFSAKHV